jgi:hypothetical protein
LRFTYLGFQQRIQSTGLRGIFPGCTTHSAAFSSLSGRKASNPLTMYRPLSLKWGEIVVCASQRQELLT